MQVTWNNYFNQYNQKGSKLDVLEISLNSDTPSGVSIKVFMKKKSGKEEYAWVDLSWFERNSFPKSKDEERFISVKDIDFN